jgi:hypothetical protein
MRCDQIFIFSFHLKDKIAIQAELVGMRLKVWRDIEYSWNGDPKPFNYIFCVPLQNIWVLTKESFYLFSRAVEYNFTVMFF